MGRILSYFIILFVSILFITPAGAEARELWLNPVEAGKKGVGNWGGVSLKKEVHFHWRVPDDFDDNTGTAVLVLIGLKDQELGYRVNISVTQNGQPHDTHQETIDTFEALVTGQLSEINLSEVLPTLFPGDYVALNFEKMGKKGKAMIVGMRYHYINTSVAGEIDSLKADIAALQAKDTTLMNDVTALQSENSAQASAISTLQAENGAQATAIGDLQAKDTELMNKDTTLMNDVAALQTEQGVQNGDISTLQTQVANLQLADPGSLAEIFTGVSRVGNDIFFDGVNVNIRNGLGATNGFPSFPDSNDFNQTVVNGLGNLIVGYNETIKPTDGPGLPASDKSGSHNIVVGHGHNYSSFGGLVVGFDNINSGPYSTVFGERNKATNLGSNVGGGRGNTASGFFSSVSGGVLNVASGFHSSVSGGSNNEASGSESSVSGGDNNDASGTGSSVSGGQSNTASGELSSVSGGAANLASGLRSSVSGGQINTALGTSSSVSGGDSNTASGNTSSVSGGFSNTASGSSSSVSGGNTRSVGEFTDWRAGGLFQDF
jgi:hypothetical protein